MFVWGPKPRTVKRKMQRFAESEGGPWTILAIYFFKKVGHTYT